MTVHQQLSDRDQVSPTLLNLSRLQFVDFQVSLLEFQHSLHAAVFFIKTIELNKYDLAKNLVINVKVTPNP